MLMKKSTAVISFTFFDIIAAIVFYFAGFKPLNDVCSGITTGAQFIRYSTSFYLGFGCIIIPLLHIIGMIETYLPKYFNRSICTKVFYGSVVLSLLVGFVTAAVVKQTILNNGYLYCEGAAIHRKLLRIETYVLDDDTCRHLTLEREERRYGKHISRK